jgi:hypothetical protein
MSGHPGQLGSKPTEVETHYSTRFMEDLDGRSAVAKELRARLRALTADLGGATGLSYMELSLCKRAVHLERLIETKELTLASGRKVDENKYTNCVATFSGLLSKIGLKRRVKILALNDYLLSKATPIKQARPVKVKGSEL